MNKDWSFLKLNLLPKTIFEARQNGSRFFFTNETCLHGHLAPRYEKGGRCVECSMMSSSRFSGTSYREISKKVIASIERSYVCDGPIKTYEPNKPCKKGHKLRWISSGNCVECDNESREKNKERIKEKRLIREYGIGLDKINEMIEAQNGKCDICRNELNLEKNMHVDHNHKTKKVRSILCSKCNQAIGLMNEDAEIIMSAYFYLEKHK